MAILTAFPISYVFGTALFSDKDLQNKSNTLQKVCCRLHPKTKESDEMCVPGRLVKIESSVDPARKRVKSTEDH